MLNTIYYFCLRFKLPLSHLGSESKHHLSTCDVTEKTLRIINIQTNYSTNFFNWFIHYLSSKETNVIHFFHFLYIYIIYVIYIYIYIYVYIYIYIVKMKIANLSYWVSNHYCSHDIDELWVYLTRGKIIHLDLTENELFWY